MIFIAADHAGFKYKERLKKLLTALKTDFTDLGNARLEPNDDYPEFAREVALKVAADLPKNRGILICDSGVGMCISANKIKGVRAVNPSSPRMAIMSRQHNNSNVLCLGQDYMSWFAAKKIIRAWLETSFSKEPRHEQRLKMIEK